MDLSLNCNDYTQRRLYLATFTALRDGEPTTRIAIFEPMMYNANLDDGSL